jgi:hypothetical protein
MTLTSQLSLRLFPWKTKIKINKITPPQATTALKELEKTKIRQTS